MDICARSNSAAPRMVVFTPSFAPRGDSESLVNTRLVKGLQNTGIEIEVLSRRCRTTPKVWNVPPDRQDLRYDVPLPRLTSFFHGLVGSENAQAARFIVEHAWGVHLAAAATRRIPPRKCDFVLSFGGFCHIAALKYAGASGIPIVATWNDPFPAQIAPPPYGRGPKEPIPWPYKRLLARIGLTAAWHVFPSERLRRYMLQFLPQAAAVRTSAIPHMASLMPARQAHADGRTFTLTHAGTLLPHRRVDVFFEGLAALLASGRCARDLRVVFIGSQGRELGETARRYGADKVCKFLPEMEHAKCASYLVDSDALLVIEAQMTESIFLPTKFVDYAQTSKPILAVAPRRGTIADLIDSYGGGVLADCNSAAEVAVGLGILCSSQQSDTPGRCGRLDSLFTEEAVVAQYSEIFRRVTSNVRSVSRTFCAAV